jgi:hypothetical protein
MKEIITMLENIREECLSNKIGIEKLSQLMNDAGKKYLSQFKGEMQSANMLALGAFLSGEADPNDFAVLSETMIKKSENNSLKNYFEFLPEELRR